MAEALGGLTGSIQGTVTGLGNKGMQYLDRIFPPETRAKVMNAITKFSSEKPMLASFLASQIALSGPALGLFAVMTISVAVFAILVAIIFAVLGTVLFILFWVGVALIFLLPTLFITTGIATFIWLWGMGTYYILKHFNEKPIPGIHTSLKDGVVENMGADNEVTHQLADLTGQKIEGSGEEKGKADRKEIEDNQQKNKSPPKLDEKKNDGGEKQKQGQGHGSSDKKESGMNGHAPSPQKAAGDVGKHASKVTGAAGGAKDQVSGATGKASGAAGQVTGVAGGAKGALGA